MEETRVGAEPAPVDTATRAERQVGPETRAVRIFREVFAQDAAAAKHLKPSLDRYLRLVLEDPTAKRGDKTYARKIYADLLRIFGGGEPVALPDFAKKHEEPVLSDKDIQDILSAADNPPPIIPDNLHIETSGVTITGPLTVGGPLVVHDVPGDQSTVIPGEGMAIDPLDGLLEPEPPDVAEERCKKYLTELMASNELPFVRVFELTIIDFAHLKASAIGATIGEWTAGGPIYKFPEGMAGPGRYVALGTVLGTVTHGKHMGKKVNIHCTVAGYRRLRDAEQDHFVYVKGRPLVVSGDDPNTGLRKHIFCIKHKAGLKIRYWMRINDKDVEERARFFVLTEEPQGVRGITRAQF